MFEEVHDHLHQLEALWSDSSFLFWMVTCSFTLYLLISHRMKAGGSVYSFIHSFIKGKCSRRYRKAQEDSGRLPQHRLPLDVGQTDGRSLDGRM